MKIPKNITIKVHFQIYKGVMSTEKISVFRANSMMSGEIAGALNNKVITTDSFFSILNFYFCTESDTRKKLAGKTRAKNVQISFSFRIRKYGAEGEYFSQKLNRISAPKTCLSLFSVFQYRGDKIKMKQ